MMKTTTLVTIGLTLAVSAFTAAAQQGQGRGWGGGRGMGAGRGPAQGFSPAVSFLLDANKDGVLSASEIDGAPAAFLNLDKNNDGQLTANELCPGGVGPRGAGCPWGLQAGGVPPAGAQTVLIAVLDADGNGALSPEEAAAAPAALRKLDLNADGQLTPDEVRPPGRGLRNGTGPRAQMGICPIANGQGQTGATAPAGPGWGRGFRNGAGPRGQAGICPFATPPAAR